MTDAPVPMVGPLVDDEKFRAVFRQLPACVSVLLAAGPDGETAALTCTSAIPLSRRPPMAAVAVGTATRMAEVLETGRQFTINFLGRHAVETAEALARRTASASGAEGRPELHIVVRHGVPSLAAGTSAVLECDVVAGHPAGDHLLVMGVIRAARLQGDETPLLYGRRLYGEFSALGSGIATKRQIR